MSNSGVPTYTTPDSSDVNKFVNVPDKDESAKVFEKDYLTTVIHSDPNMHWIGEGLPAPSAAELVPVGQANDEGVSVFPARADHSHDTKLLFEQCVDNGLKLCPSGNTSLNNLSHYSGTNMLSANTYIQFPTPGLWQVIATIRADRVGGGVFTGLVNFVSMFNNATNLRTLLRYNPAGISTFLVLNVADAVYYPNPASATNNIAFQYQHNDSVSHNVTIPILTAVRLTSV